MLLSAVSVLASLPLAALADAISQSPIHNLTQALLQNGMPAHAIPQSEYLSNGGINGSCATACFSLHQTFGDTQVESRGEPIYNATINYYWSAQQREARPQCIFKPEKALDVATLVLLSQITGCPFAARSGGHAAFAGASNVNGGITVVLERMKDITLSKDKKIASIGPGSIWYDIYTRLAKDNLAVVGGRVAALGIGGLTTGGGISFFANQYGWACDNVASYEVVLADGRIVTAKPNSPFSDLYWALRGGGNNLGIVTRFDLTTFVHGPLMLGGHRIFLNTSFSAAIDAFVNLGNKAADDTKATQILSVALDPTSGTRVAVAELEYADAVEQPPILEEYRKIPAISDTLQLNTLANLTKALNDTNPKGFRESFWTASSKLDHNMVDFAFNISFDAFDTVRDIPGILPANTIQVITVPQLEQMQKNGGNALGLSPSDGPILFLNINFRWNNEQDDERVLRACAEIVTKFKQEAKRRNLENKYLYMNYASQFQDVIGSYGESAERLRQVAKSYDPNGVFQVLQPGYFKLWGAPSRKEAGVLV